VNAVRAWLVKLEFKRVQTYLFAVSELKSMIGANALMGEVLRGQLKGGRFQGEDNLPALAVTCGASLPDDVGSSLENLGLARKNSADPLQGEDSDDPRTAYELGVLARDGGHFRAVFPAEPKALAFVDQARDLIGRKLPGLPMTDRVLPLVRGEKGWQFEKDTAQPPPRTKGAELLDLPLFQVCGVTQQGPAEQLQEEPSGEGVVPVSAAVKAKRAAADRFNKGESKDLLGLLRDDLLRRLELQGNPFPKDFLQLAPVSGQLAVIAADGNGIGARSTAWRSQRDGEDFFCAEARGESFFHAMRTTVRIALVTALVETFQPLAAKIRGRKSRPLPFRLMMLGGDDLLLVCDAAYAMPFLVRYARELEARPQLPDKRGQLHVGAGVSIVKRTFPFHRAHALAEELAASAKRLYRTFKDSPGSTADWVAITEAWHGNVKEVRQADGVIRSQRADGSVETLVLSDKPYRILGKAPSGEPAATLEALLETATAAAEGARGAERLGRSQLIALGHALPRGRLQADWAARWAPDEVRWQLRGILHSESVWRGGGKDTWVTRLLDFLELYELERLRLEAEANEEVSRA